MERQGAGRTVAVAGVVVGIVLVLLTAVAVTTVTSIRASQEEVERLSARVTAWRDLQVAVAEEAYAEAGYRRAPSEQARSRLDGSIAEVSERVEAAREVADRRDATTLSYVLVLNERYVSEVRRTLDTEAVPGADDRVAGPALDSLSALIAGAVQGHRERAADARAAQADWTALLSWSVPAITVLGALALGLCWRLLVRQHRRLQGDAAAAAEQARRDPLTGLLNRDALRAAVEERQAGGSAFALLALDLDRFKQVNDTLGHHAGDALLIAVADGVRGAVRSDDLVARVGGDEFAVLVSTADAAERVVGRVTDVVGELAVAYDTAIGVSVGVARWPEEAQTYDELSAFADAAMYEAKRARRVSAGAGPVSVPPQRWPDQPEVALTRT